jgi:uncharacterized membrane protein
MQNLTLVAATLTTGLMAGLFFAFTCAVMPALRGTDDRAFVDVMQRINVSIINPAFLAVFMGGLVLTAAACVATWRDTDRGALPWIIGGLVLYAAMFVITRAINIPLNDQLETAGDPSRITDLGTVRDNFEGKWVVWNIVRTVANVAAFACLSYALLVHGRSTAADTAPSDRPSAVAITTRLPPPDETARHNGVPAKQGVA